MDTIHLLLLSIIQGLTEFIPISSSAHLILLSEIIDQEDQGIFFDVCVHFGTTIAAVIYFKKEIKEMILKISIKRLSYSDNSLFFNLLVALTPVLIFGYLFRGTIENNLRSEEIIAYSTIGFGLLLFISDKLSLKEKELSSLKVSQAFMIGIFQCLALIPGTSRSGITITAGLMLGLKGTEAARFSFLLAIPTIGVIAMAELFSLSGIVFLKNLPQIALVVLISFLTAYATIGIFLRLINKIGFTPFVIYRLLLGLLIIIFWL